MARYGQRPENALKRANEFIDVGKPARALDTLQEVFRNKKWSYNLSESILEPIMFKYLDLCVELKKSHIAKEGLFQYRNLFQSVNVGSLENVIRGYLRMAEEKTENAREKSAQAVIDIDDLDNLATPESILLSAVSGEDAQDRSDRTILTPWVKFLWESYCQCLELLRTNAHVETLYHDIARMAFQFCLKYNRKTEFRKLCDKLRKHLEDICKLPAQVANVSISKPETQQFNLETRLFQLDSAIQMELWQEAYKAIEDIHNLMNMSKKMPVPKTMANYYQKLAMVFWKAGNYLFHAAALLKLYQLSKDMKKNMTPEELQKMACRVLIATLAIPLPSAHPEFDRFIETDKSPMEKAQKLAVLLSLPQPPTRASLLKDVARYNVIHLATPQLQDLYNWLEVDFHPLLLCGRVHSVIESLQAEDQSGLQLYVPALQDVTLVRLVRQVAQVYQTIEFKRLISLAKFTNAFHMERLLVDCVRHNDMQIRIDHGKDCVHFGMDLSESQREDKPEGPTLQSMPSEQIRNQLVNMATVLHQSIAVINPHKKRQEREKVRAAMVASYHDNKVREHEMILQRHKIIEDRKEYIEKLNTVREEEEQRRLEEIAKQQALAEQKRLEQEREERERKRAQNEIQQIKDRHWKEKMAQISQTAHGQKILKKLDEDDIKKMDADQIAAREVEELQKEKRELQAKLKSQEKKVDYFERAKRIEEIPLLQVSMKERQLQDQAFWEQQENERIATAIEERKLAVATQERMIRMKPDKDAFLEKLLKERNVLYEDKLREFDQMMAEERRKRLDDRKAKRKEERRRKYLREKEEEEERLQEEMRRIQEEEYQQALALSMKKQEEEERQEREEKERRYKEQQEMLDRAAAKQRARELEIEQKLQEEREAGGRDKMIRDRDSKAEGGASTWRSGGAPKRGGEVGDRDASSGGGGGPWRKFGDKQTATAGGGGSQEEGGAPKKDDAWKPSRLRGNVGGEQPTKEDSWRRGGDRSEGGGRRDERRDDRKGVEDRRDDRRGGEDRRDDRRGGEDRRDDRRGGEDRRDDRRGGEDRRDDRRGGEDRRDDRRGGEDRRGGASWRGGKDDDSSSSLRRGGGGGGGGSNQSRGIGGSADWRNKRDDSRKDDRRTNDRREEQRGGEDRRGGGAPPISRSEKPREAQTEDDGWSRVKRR